MHSMSRFRAARPIQLQTLITDLHRRVQLLDVDIQDEESNARVSDPADPAYPPLARPLSARRVNLLATIAMLEAD